MLYKSMLIKGRNLQFSVSNSLSRTNIPNISEVSLRHGIFSSCGTKRGYTNRIRIGKALQRSVSLNGLNELDVLLDFAELTWVGVGWNGVILEDAIC